MELHLSSIVQGLDKQAITWSDIRLLVGLLVVMTPIYGLVVWFLKRGPDKAIEDFKRQYQSDLDGLGRKVETMKGEHDIDRAEVRSLRKEVTESHREIMDMLRATAEATTNNIHKTSEEIRKEIHANSLKLARLDERADLGESLTKCFTDLSTTLRAVIPRQRGGG